MSTGREVFQVEIRARDLARSIRFYGAVFAWKIYQSAPGYALVDTGRLPVVGILHDPRLPLGVCNNVLVEDCQATADRAVALGGSVCLARSEVPGSGAYIGTLDPWGNELFLWQPYTDGRPHLEAAPDNPIVFLEIVTPDRRAATTYYKKLVGWSFKGVSFAEAYAIAKGCGLARGIGLYTSAGGHGTTNYVQVASLAETVARVDAAGGKVLAPPAAFPGGGRYVLFQDPDGNRIGALEPT
ncbi:MAG: hypothetical protein H6709_17420 [Kofleriaceae bacterium]|nr:hypothetical protein [Myxococcales bacterium]MCB9564440.1 hypothetical protein [Kofleriaceae bacterium]MCB9573863.1 hypothetical protein [Kofleriaceae bacterium]